MRKRRKERRISKTLWTKSNRIKRHYQWAWKEELINLETSQVLLNLKALPMRIKANTPHWSNFYFWPGDSLWKRRRRRRRKANLMNLKTESQQKNCKNEMFIDYWCDFWTKKLYNRDFTIYTLNRISRSENWKEKEVEDYVLLNDEPIDVKTI